MRLEYREVNADDLVGSTVADYLVNIEAFFEVLDGGDTIYAEPCFPVTELARELFRWVSLEEEPTSDFYFSSLSFGEVGALTMSRELDGWVVSSIFTPEVKSSPRSWSELHSRIGEFIENVYRDVLRLGVSPDLIRS
ncbi:DUF7878 domain-containing protein [Streptomyces alkaliphilus]|uniref:DUF7878 domain-containing protein n=1 Tax=Streptomyces alkaliphilus TaxID=1472722 RepID=A0A646IHU4_9ACTN|nr:hypothetical protein [Streptomyces alkaliphilus]MQS09755.1 hypothetical protein [Streptomyces alkaliphilus]